MTKSILRGPTISFHFNTAVEAVALWKNSKAKNGVSKWLNAKDRTVTLSLFN
jgi:hypothetical protein